MVAPIWFSDEPRVLVCGSRRWPYRHTVHSALDRLHAPYGERLVVIEGNCRGADLDAHVWCEQRGLALGRQHLCHPVDWAAERRARPKDWRMAGPERNTRQLMKRPGLILAFHEWLDPAKGGTSDMALRGLLCSVPVFLVSGEDPAVGMWLKLDDFPRARRLRVGQEIDMADPLLRGE